MFSFITTDAYSISFDPFSISSCSSSYLFIYSLSFSLLLSHSLTYFSSWMHFCFLCIQDCGYYYESNNITMAAEKLYEATALHDQNTEAYNKRADECVERFSVFHPENIAGYEKLVDNILALPPRFPLQ